MHIHTFQLLASLADHFAIYEARAVFASPLRPVKFIVVSDVTNFPVEAGKTVGWPAAPVLDLSNTETGEPDRPRQEKRKSPISRLN